jgi:hypothetical protein
MIHAQIIGLSHTNSLRAALKKRPRDFQKYISFIHMLAEAPDRQFVHSVDDDQRLHPALLDKLKTSKKRVIFSQVGGNAHNFMGLFEHPAAYDFVLPSQPDLPLQPNAQIVPYAYVSEVMRNFLALDLKVLNALKIAANGSPVFHIESPPPVEDNDFCQNNLPPSFLTKGYANMKIASPVFRYKLWRLHSEILRRECERLGFGFVASPSSSMDEDGFLLREYYIDPLHGNVEYGALVLDQIQSLMTGQRPTEVLVDSTSIIERLPETTGSTVCNICGHSAFGSGPNGRYAQTGQPPRCCVCDSLERHRIVRRVFQALPMALLAARDGLQFGTDPGIDANWFRHYEVYDNKSGLDAQVIDQPDGSYGFISLNHVLERVPDDIRAFGELCRVLSDDGILQICFGAVMERKTTQQLAEAHQDWGTLRLYGRDLAQHFGCAERGISVLAVEEEDPCTGVREVVHFFFKRQSDAQRMRQSITLWSETARVLE